MNYDNLRGQTIDLSYIKKHKSYEKAKEHFPNLERQPIDLMEYLEQPENFTDFTDQEIAVILHGPVRKTLTNNQYERMYLRTLSEKGISYEMSSGPNLKMNLYQLAPAFALIGVLLFLMLALIVTGLIPEFDAVSAVGWIAAVLALPYLAFVGMWWRSSQRAAFGIAWGMSHR